VQTGALAPPSSLAHARYFPLVTALAAAAADREIMYIPHLVGARVRLIGNLITEGLSMAVVV
jgi:hypothetical protein